MAPSTPLSIATGAVQRLVKEEASYQREKKDQEQRLEKLSEETSDDENREYMLNQEVGSPLPVYSSSVGVFTALTAFSAKL